MTTACQTSPFREPNRTRRRRERPWVAVVAVAIVVGLLLCKNNCHIHFLKPRIITSHANLWAVGETFGWPRIFAWRESKDYPVSPDVRIVASSSWPAILLDVAVAIVATVATWIVFRRTQRDSERWNQISLATLLALVALAAIICGVANSEAVGPGFITEPTDAGVALYQRMEDAGAGFFTVPT